MIKETAYPFIIIAIIIITTAVVLTQRLDYVNSSKLYQQDLDEQAEVYLAKLDKINYLPSLLPVILNNSDIIELDQKQIDTLTSWRTENREKVIATMNQIVKKRAELKRVALSPGTSAHKLVALQDDIFKLQRDVMNYKLSCRDLVIKTLNADNWDGLYMVLADEGYAFDLPQTQVAAIR